VFVIAEVVTAASATDNAIGVDLLDKGLRGARDPQAGGRVAGLLGRVCAPTLTRVAIITDTELQK